MSLDGTTHDPSAKPLALIPEGKKRAPPKGCWKPGQSGNLAGRPRNANARATAKEIRTMILRKGKPVLRAVIARAKAGDIACAKAIFDLTLPRGRVLCVALPKVRDSASAAQMLTALLDHVGEGNVTPAEANSLSAVVERYSKIAAMARLEERVGAVEKRVGGHAP